MEAGFVTVITLVTVVTNSHTHSDKLKTFPASVKLKVQSGSKAGSCPVVVQGLNVRWQQRRLWVLVKISQRCQKFVWWSKCWLWTNNYMILHDIAIFTNRKSYKSKSLLGTWWILLWLDRSALPLCTWAAICSSSFLGNRLWVQYSTVPSCPSQEDSSIFILLLWSTSKSSKLLKLENSIDLQPSKIFQDLPRV